MVQHGTLPLDDLYFALKPGSRNLGEVDYPALLAGRPQTLVANPEGAYQRNALTRTEPHAGP